MAWCYYCRRHTVNGRCPNCNRAYEEKKQHDGINWANKKSSGYEGVSYSQGSSFIGGFFLGLLINFPAIIIVKRIGGKIVAGAIVGTVINSIALLQIGLMVLYLCFPDMQYLMA